MNLICVRCGKHTNHKKINGSMKYPVCDECYEEYFDNDWDKYNDAMEWHLGYW